jgi:hypothetical protein
MFNITSTLFDADIGVSVAVHPVFVMDGVTEVVESTVVYAVCTTCNTAPG